MIILCSDEKEYGEYSPRDVEHLLEAFKSLDYEVSIHKIKKGGRIFPRLPEDVEFMVGFGLNERKITPVNVMFFSIQPMIIFSNSPIDYRFVKTDNMYVSQNVNNLPFNAIISCYDLNQ